MSPADQAVFAFASQLLAYPDKSFFDNMGSNRLEFDEYLSDENLALTDRFISELASQGIQQAQENYVAVFDHDPAASLYMAWHRYGNDRAQGKAMAALNGLYRIAGFEPLPGEMPDYLPRILEFLSVCEDWAAEVILDAFGPELNALENYVASTGICQGMILKMALEPLRRRWPGFFKPRLGIDPTKRAMAQPEPELKPLTINSGS